MNQETGEKLLDKDGKEITSEKEFTAESKNGSIDIRRSTATSLSRQYRRCMRKSLQEGHWFSLQLKMCVRS